MASSGLGIDKNPDPLQIPVTSNSKILVFLWVNKQEKKNCSKHFYIDEASLTNLRGMKESYIDIDEESYFFLSIIN